MMAILFAEFRKLVSIRSTYVISAIGLLLTAFISFWGIGYKGQQVFAPGILQNAIFNQITIAAIFMGIVAILVICHEYRYNMVSYTLTSSNSRLKVFAGKFAIVAAYALVITLISIPLIIGMVLLGAHIGHHTVGLQTIDVYETLWKTIAYMVGGAWFGLLLGFLSRNMVFAIVAYFVVPSLEAILQTFLKVEGNFLPNTAQGQILQTGSSPGVYSALASLGVFAAYLVVLTIVSAVLFARKDAN